MKTVYMLIVVLIQHGTPTAAGVHAIYRNQLDCRAGAQQYLDVHHDERLFVACGPFEWSGRR